MCLILAITLGLLSVDDVRMQRDLALLSLLFEWPHKLLYRFATLISSDRLQLLVDRVGHRAWHHHAVLATRALCHASVARPKDAMAHNRCLGWETRPLRHRILVGQPTLQVVWDVTAECFHSVRDCSCLGHEMSCQRAELRDVCLIEVVLRLVNDSAASHIIELHWDLAALDWVVDKVSLATIHWAVVFVDWLLLASCVSQLLHSWASKCFSHIYRALLKSTASIFSLIVYFNRAVDPACIGTDQEVRLLVCPSANLQSEAFMLWIHLKLSLL